MIELWILPFVNVTIEKFIHLGMHSMFHIFFQLNKKKIFLFSRIANYWFLVLLKCNKKIKSISNISLYKFTIIYIFFKGIYDIQGNTRNGQRCSTAKAYLVPAENRENLDIIIKAMVKKVSNSRFDYYKKWIKIKWNIYIFF